jgi:hypothetical protein
MTNDFLFYFKKKFQERIFSLLFRWGPPICTVARPLLYSVETGSGQDTRKKKTGRLLTLFMAWYGTALHSIGTCQPILLLESASPSSTCSILECGKYIRVSNYANSGVRIGQVGAAVPSWKSGKVCQSQ